MQTLVNLVAQKTTLIDLFRTAHFWRFSRDLSIQSAAKDVVDFLNVGNAPKYVVEYVVHLYSKH